VTDDRPGGWQVTMRGPGEGVEQWADLLQQFRTLGARLAAAHPTPEVMRALTADLAAVAAQLKPFDVPEVDRFAGRTPGLPGRGHPLLAPVIVDESTPTSMRGRVTFTDFHLGGNGAAHGGSQPLLFDDVLGIMVTDSGRLRARTASLTVNYRLIAPVNVELSVEATVDRHEGRKTWATGRLWDGERLLADAEGLFIELRDGQP
jgi:acyl-coenzyme A thioesterase PaaI-like protein